MGTCGVASAVNRSLLAVSKSSNVITRLLEGTSVGWFGSMGTLLGLSERSSNSIHTSPSGVTTHSRACRRLIERREARRAELPGGERRAGCDGFSTGGKGSFCGDVEKPFKSVRVMRSQRPRVSLAFTSEIHWQCSLHIRRKPVERGVSNDALEF
jgi:hypothetical protein